MEKRLLLSAIAGSSLLLTGCGADDRSSESKVETDYPTAIVQAVSGKVIDGYINGAEVFLDLNGNGLLDDGEPNTISEAAGDYKLELDEEHAECFAYVPLVVNVPVGAIDEDQGEVTEAYTMTLEPPFKKLTDGELRHISPLTTLVWDSVKTELSKEINANEFSCDELKRNQDLRRSIKDALETSVAQQVSHHNIPAEKIYSDFIAEGDDSRRELAISIVKGLQASYQYHLQLSATVENDAQIRVAFYQGSQSDNENAYPDAWYRDVTVFFNDGGYRWDLDKVEDDLSTLKRKIYVQEQVRKPYGNGSFALTKDIYSYGGDDSDYNCINSESVEFRVDNIIYSLSNSSADQVSETFEGCANTRVGDGIYRYLTVRELDEANGKEGSASFTQTAENGEFADLNHWRQLEEKEEQIDEQELVGYLEASGFRFDEDVAIPASSWIKNKTEYVDDGSMIVLSLTWEGDWERKTYYADGTHLTECSDTGENFSAENCKP